MSVHPCEARRYLGMGLTEGGGGHDRMCADPISYRLTFHNSDGNRVGVAYMCPAHAAETVAILSGQGTTPAGMLHGLLTIAEAEHGRIEQHPTDTLWDAGLGPVRISAYRPRTDARREAQIQGVGR